MFSVTWLATHTLLEKSKARSFRCCNLALSHGLELLIGITSLHLSPLDRIIEKKNYSDYDYDTLTLLPGIAAVLLLREGNLALCYMYLYNPSMKFV